MIGEFDLGDFKIGDPDLGTVENIVQLPAGRPAGVGRLPVDVGIF